MDNKYECSTINISEKKCWKCKVLLTDGRIDRLKGGVVTRSYVLTRNCIKFLGIRLKEDQDTYLCQIS